MLLKISSGLLIAFAITLQIQFTLFEHESYQGLRVGASDFILPFAGVFMLITLLLHKSRWPVWQKPFGYWAIALLTSILALALLNGFALRGEWSQWAVLNKGAGWIVLMAYFMAGAWLTTNHANKIFKYFLLPLCIFMIVSTIFVIVLMLLFYANTYKTFVFMGYDYGFDLSGFMVNRNAFAFLYLCGMSIVTPLLLWRKNLSRNERYVFYTLWLLLPITLGFNLSRAAIFSAILLVVFTTFIAPKPMLRRLLPLLMIGMLLLPLMHKQRVAKVAETFGQIEQSMENASQDNLYVGDKVRFNVFKDSLNLIKGHPLTGAGLGGLLAYQEEQGREEPMIMDNTALWILTEMGPFGLLGFLCVYVAMLVALWRKSKGLDDDYALFARGVFFMLLVFGAFSMFHEILYSRFLWFFLGLGLAVPAANLRQKQFRDRQKTAPEA